MLQGLEELFVEVTNCCHQKCVHCSSSASSKGYPIILFKYLKKMIDDAIPMGLHRFTISGGEPFLYPDIGKLIKYLHDRNIYVSMYSCGAIMGEDYELHTVPKAQIQQLVECGLNKMIFSLHGGSAYTQDCIAGTRGSYDSVIKTIENALKYNIEIEIHTVPMKLNYNELERIVAIAQKMGVKGVSFLRYVPQGRGDSALELSSDEYLQLLNCREKWNNKYPNVDLRFGTPYNCLDFSGKKCTAAINKLLISASGEYFPCEAFKFMKGQRPTIYEKNIKDIWYDDILLKQIRDTSIDDIDYCNACAKRKACKGGCAGQRLRVNYSLIKGPDPCCSR